MPANKDKELMENLLWMQKGVCDLMMHGAIESSTTDVHNTFADACADSLTVQNDLYDKMSAKGWYPTERAERKKVLAARQKYAKQSKAKSA